MASALAPSILQIAPDELLGPDELPKGGVLVVGASSTGVQMAEEIQCLWTAGDACGRRSHAHATPLPRRRHLRVDGYRGHPRRPMQETGNLSAARRQPSLQVVGRPDNRDLDLGILSRQGIRLTGRLAGTDGVKAVFSGDLESTTAASHARMLRILDRIDECIDRGGFEAPSADPGVRIPFRASGDPLTLDLRRARIRSVVWATGYIRRYPWLNVPVLDSRGEIVHRGGVATVPGMFVLGLTFLRRRRSPFIGGCGLDAEELAPLVKGHLDLSARRVA